MSGLLRLELSEAVAGASSVARALYIDVDCCPMRPTREPAGGLAGGGVARNDTDAMSALLTTGCDTATRLPV